MRTPLGMITTMTIMNTGTIIKTTGIITMTSTTIMKTNTVTAMSIRLDRWNTSVLACSRWSSSRV